MDLNFLVVLDDNFQEEVDQVADFDKILGNVFDIEFLILERLVDGRSPPNSTSRFSPVGGDDIRQSTFGRQSSELVTNLPVDNALKIFSFLTFVRGHAMHLEWSLL